MSRVSLPGLSLSAVVVVAALLALLVFETGDNTPGQYQSPPESNAIMRLSEARGAVEGRQVSSEVERRRASQRAAGRARAARAQGRSVRTGTRRVNRGNRRGAQRRGSGRSRSRRGASRRGGSGLGPGRSGTPVASPPAAIETGSGSETALVPTADPGNNGKGNSSGNARPNGN